MTKRKIIIGICVALLSVAFAVQPVSAKKLKFALIAHDITSPFSTFFKQGGQDAADLVGADFKYMGTTAIDMAKQAAMFENAIQAGYDGIATTMMDPAAFKRGVEIAQSKNVVIASFNMDGNWGKRVAQSYSGSDLYQQGYEIGSYFFSEVMKGKGKYILIPALAQLDVLIWRMDGIKKAAAEHPDIELITTVEIGTDMSQIYGRIENAYTAHPDVDAFFGTDFFSEPLAKFIKNRNLVGKVKGAVFDITPGILKGLDSGALQVTTDQNPYLQGYYAIMQLYLMIEKGQPGIEINTSSTIVTKANMKPYTDHYGMGQ